ncbi:MAG: hypothetical protein KJZ90_03415 [Rhodocyclaceae bacterium]|nr:hypothetical protein [Rhodocyclaceae bacterium]
MDLGHDVEPTAKVIDDLAEDLRRRAIELDRTAADLRKTGDFDYASIVLQTAISAQNMRLDLLVTRPLRALGKR